MEKNYLELEGKFNKNCKIFNNEVEDEALATIQNILDNKAFENVPVRIMPDVHDGKGIVIGFTAPISDAICPSHVGVDIGCSITTYLTDKEINPEEYPLIEHRIKKEIPMGMNIHDKRQFEMKDFIKFIKKEYNKAVASWGEMIEEKSISEATISEMIRRISMDEGVFYKSIGTVGGGNHFIEIGNHDGKYAFTIHCGSRNLGVKVCKYWENIANSCQIDKAFFKNEVNKLKESIEDKTLIPEKIKELKVKMEAENAPTGYLTGENMKGYLSDMVIAQAYAKFNHLIIGEKIATIFKKINKAKVVETIQSIHNYVDLHDHIIRKGAIRAYKDEKMVVPFNMRDGLAICIGKSNPDWNYSCAHGAGRKMSRNKAKNTLSINEFKAEMNGIYSTTVNMSTIDESPMAYKDFNTIVDYIKETCDILYFIKPVINIKSGDND